MRSLLSITGMIKGTAWSTLLNYCLSQPGEGGACFVHEIHPVLTIAICRGGGCLYIFLNVLQIVFIVMNSICCYTCHTPPLPRSNAVLFPIYIDKYP